MESTLFMEFQRQLDQVQQSKSGLCEKKAQMRVQKEEFEMLKANQKLVAEAEDLRRKLKSAEERVRNMEKLFRDANKKMTPKEVRILIDKKLKSP